MAEPAMISVGPIETPDLRQIAFWPGSAEKGAARLAKALGVKAPPPGRVAAGKGGRLLRVELLVWWVLDAGEVAFAPDPEEGAALDLSGTRALVRIEGARCADLLARFTAIDLRERSFPEGAAASTGIAHSPATVIRREAEGAPGYDLYLSRSFAGSVRELLLDVAAQFARR